MNGFPSVTLEFEGKQYEVASDRVWGLLNAIEPHITFTGLAKRLSSGDIPRVAICSAFAAALTYASGKHFMPQDVSEKLPMSDLTTQAGALLEILAIPERSREKKPKEDAPGKRKATTRAKTSQS